MQYYLSRNNQVTGPYSKEALLQHGILPTDLVKEESGAEWRAPESFGELKSAAGTAKPKYKITADKEVIEVKTDISKSQEPAETTANSPFKRMPSAAPKKKNAEENAGTQKTEAKKDIPRNTAKPAVTNIEQAPKTEYKKAAKSPVIRPQRKENSTNAFKEIFAPLFILGGIGFAAWFGYKRFFSSPSGSSNIVIQAVPADSLSKQPVISDTTKHTKPVVAKKTITDSSAYYAHRDSVRQAERAKKDSLALAANAARKDSLKINKTPTESTTVKKEIAVAPEKKKAETIPDKATTGKPAEKKVTSAKKGKSIGDYVALSLNKIPDKEIKGIRLNVKNISDQPLNIAIVDVSYLDTDGKVIRGETLQAENIGAGKSVSVKVPNEKKAANISYKVSLISGDSVYLMGK